MFYPGLYTATMHGRSEPSAFVAPAPGTLSAGLPPGLAAGLPVSSPASLAGVRSQLHGSAATASSNSNTGEIALLCIA